MATDFKLPELGEGIETADVAQILVAEGDEIKAEQPVLELETDKAVVEVPCPHAGKVTKVHVAEGDTIQVGQTLLTVEESGNGARTKTKPAAASRAKPDEAKKQAKPDQAASGKNESASKQAGASGASTDAGSVKSAKAADKPTEAKIADELQEDDDAKPGTAARSQSAPSAPDRKRTDGRHAQPPPAGPATRRLAHILGIALEQTKGTGPRGRITLEDIVRAHDATTSRGGIGGVPIPKLPDFSKDGEILAEPLNKIAQTTIENLTRSWLLIPHVTQQGLADITELEAVRKKYVEQAGDQTPKVTLTAIAVKAVVAVLKEFPRFNSSVDAENKRLIYKKYYHIGVAVDTERGLLVPVIRDADRKHIADIAAEIADLAERAKQRKLDLKEMQGATFTISNQGGIGGTAFTPIVNWPEVAILGMSRSTKQMTVVGDDAQIRLILPLSLSYDHRAANGAEAARFIVRLGEILSDSHKLLFEA